MVNAIKISGTSNAILLELCHETLPDFGPYGSVDPAGLSNFIYCPSGTEKDGRQK
jgi:hypothetical protein